MGYHKKGVSNADRLVEILNDPFNKEQVFKYIERKTVRDEATGCLLWSNNNVKPETIFVDGSYLVPRRVWWYLNNPDIPPLNGKQLENTCKDPFCVAHEHVIPFSVKDPRINLYPPHLIKLANKYDVHKKANDVAAPLFVRKEQIAYSREEQTERLQEILKDQEVCGYAKEYIARHTKRTNRGCLQWQSNENNLPGIRLGSHYYGVRRIWWVMNNPSVDLGGGLKLNMICKNGLCIECSHVVPFSTADKRVEIQQTTIDTQEQTTKETPMNFESANNDQMKAVYDLISNLKKSNCDKMDTIIYDMVIAAIKGESQEMISEYVIELGKLVDSIALIEPLITEERYKKIIETVKTVKAAQK